MEKFPMFRIVTQRTAWWPIVFPGVTEEGAVIENRIELRFVILNEDEFPDFLATLLSDAKPSAGENAQPQSVTTASRFGRVVMDWRGVAAENGEPLAYSIDNFQILLRVPNFAAALGRAYVACRNATPEIREGN
jgi:hypothetical protein